MESVFSAARGAHFQSFSICTLFSNDSLRVITALFTNEVWKIQESSWAVDSPAGTRGLSPGDAESIDTPSCGTWSVKGRLGWTGLPLRRAGWLAREGSEPQGGIGWKKLLPRPPPHSPSKCLKTQGLAFFCIFLPGMDDARSPATVSRRSPAGPGACISTRGREDQKAPARRQVVTAETAETGSDRHPRAGPTG